MKWILITGNNIFDPFCPNEWQGWAKCPPECRCAGTCGNVLHSCQLSAVWWWPAPADRMQYFIPSALSPVNPHTINGPSYSSRHAEARYFIVSCSGRKCDEDRDTKQRVTTLFSVSVTAILSHPSLACLGLKWTKIFECDKKYLSLCAPSCHVPVSVSSVPMVQWFLVSMSAEMTTCCLLTTRSPGGWAGENWQIVTKGRVSGSVVKATP